MQADPLAECLEIPEMKISVHRRKSFDENRLISWLITRKRQGLVCVHHELDDMIDSR